MADYYECDLYQSDAEGSEEPEDPDTPLAYQVLTTLHFYLQKHNTHQATAGQLLPYFKGTEENFNRGLRTAFSENLLQQDGGLPFIQTTPRGDRFLYGDDLHEDPSPPNEPETEPDDYEDDFTPTKTRAKYLLWFAYYYTEITETPPFDRQLKYLLKLPPWQYKEVREYCIEQGWLKKQNGRVNRYTYYLTPTGSRIVSEMKRTPRLEHLESRVCTILKRLGFASVEEYILKGSPDPELDALRAILVAFDIFC